MKIRRQNANVMTRAMHGLGIQTPQLAKDAGISLNYAYAVRHGLVPAAETRQRIADVLQVAEAVLWPVEDDDDDAMVEPIPTAHPPAPKAAP